VGTICLFIAQSNVNFIFHKKILIILITYYILHRRFFFAVEELVEETDHNYSSVGCLQRAINCVNSIYKSISGGLLLDHTIFPRTESGTFLDELQIACAPECENMTGPLVTFIAASVVRNDT
jgi:hypothetical protein